MTASTITSKQCDIKDSALADQGLQIEGDPDSDFTETHQVLLRTARGQGEHVADRLDNCVLVTGDSFFGFLGSGRIDPWQPGAHHQNETVAFSRLPQLGELQQVVQRFV